MIAALCLLIPVAAEAVACLFLPPPVIHKLPMLKQIADPVVGYRLHPNQKAFSLDAPVTTNRWGYRGPDWTVEKPEGVIRIAVLGASLTFGHGVENGDLFAAMLEKQLNQTPPQPGKRYEVLNFGVGGYDIGHSINVLKTDVLKFQPDITLLNLFIGDVFFVGDYSFYPEFFRRQEKKFSRLRWDFLNLCRRSRLAMWLWDEIKNNLWGRQPNEVDQMIKTYAIEGLSPLEGPNAAGWRFITERLRDYSEITQKAGIPAVFLVLPTHEEISDPRAKSTYAKYLEEKSREFGIRYISFMPYVRQNQKLVESFLMPYDFHFTKDGHAWLAARLAGELTPVLTSRGKAGVTTS